VYLGLHLKTLSVFRCGVNETLAILGRYTPWKGTYRRFGTTYPSDFRLQLTEYYNNLDIYYRVKTLFKQLESSYNV